MSKKLLMNNYSENGFEWDYEKKSENPILIRDLCREYISENKLNINLNTFSNNQILEIDIHSVRNTNNEPQIILLCGENTGGKVYWNENFLKMGNNPNFNLKLKYPIKLRLTLIDNIFSLYVDEVLKASINVYTSQYLPFTGVQLIALGIVDITATGFRYKNFE